MCTLRFYISCCFDCQVALEDASLIDGVVAYAAYPSTRDEYDQKREARLTMQLPVPTFVFQFDRDTFCNAAKYPHWYSQFALAAAAIPSSDSGHSRRPRRVSQVVHAES
jgi:hypothetical protein